MALTTGYSITPLLYRTLPAPSIGSNSDTVGLSGGGFATVADDDSGGFSKTTFYDAAGNVTKSPFLLITDSKIAQLTNGDVVFAGARSGGGVDYDIETSDGGYFIGSISSDVRDSNADVAALAGGGFAVAYQRALSANSHDIVIDIRDSIGTLVTSRSLTAVGDQVNASVAGLADGGFAVVFEETFAFGHSKAFEEVFNADGSIRGGGSFDLYGNIHHQLSVTALQSGGFAVGYQEDDRDETQTDISVATFNSTGSEIPTHSVRASTLSTDDSEAAVTTLSNGLVMSTFTNHFGGDRDDYDIRGTLIDPIGAVLTDPSDPLKIDFSGDVNSESSVSATGLAQFVVSYSSSTTGDVTQKTFQLVRTVTGEASADTFTGDDAVDIVNGLGGTDSLDGGANNDTLNGGDGSDLLHGGTGNDLLDGGNNNDFLFGDDGDDTLKGGTGADTLLGGLGNDLFYVDTGGDEVDEAAGGGTDRVVTSVSYTLAAGQSIETLTPVSFNNTTAIGLTGNALAQSITGNAGDNTISDGGAGAADSLSGLGGNDVYIVNNAADVVNEAANGGTDRVAASVAYALTVGQSIEALTTTANGGTTNINLTGNALAQAITGNAGNNSISDGGAGAADTMSGLGGNDIYIVNNSGDVVNEAANAGTDRVAAGVSYSLGAGQSIETLAPTSYGTTTSLVFNGNALAQAIIGNAGNNVIDGKGGNDTLTGKGGNDTFRFDTTPNTSTNDPTVTDFSVAADIIELSHAIYGAVPIGSLSPAAFFIGSAANDASDRIVYNSGTGALLYDADGNGGGAFVQFAKLSSGLNTLSASQFKVTA